MIQSLHDPMTRPENPAEAPATKAPPAELFPAAEVEEFKSADWKAAAMVAGLMVSIFTIGLIIYVVVLSCAMAGPP